MSFRQVNLLAGVDDFQTTILGFPLRSFHQSKQPSIHPSILLADQPTERRLSSHNDASMMMLNSLLDTIVERH